MGSSKRNLLTSILLLVVMGVFAVLTIFIVVDAINKKYYNDIKVEYEVQEESPNIILTFARNEGSNFGTDDTKVVLSEDNKKFRIDGTVPTIENGIVTNLDELTSGDGREFYFFSTNSSFIDPQEDPENPDFIFSETDSRYYVSTESDPIWYDVPKSSENLTLYSVFLTPNVHNSDFANAPLLNTSPNVIISHDVTEIPYNAFSNAFMEGDLSMAAKIESVVIPNSVESINSKFDMVSGIVGGAFAACTTLTNIIIPSSVEYVGGEAFMSCTGLDTVEYGNGYYLPTEDTQYAILIDTNLKAEDVTIHADCISIQGDTFSKYFSIMLGLITPGEEDYINMNLQKITIPKNVKNIGFAAFYMCISLENVVFEDNSNLTSIGIYSFIECSNLKTINLEVTKVEELSGVFESCSSLTSITIPDSVTSIEGAFYGCSSLTSITIPESVTSIGSSAFSRCSSLTSITIPESVTSIGERAFYGCSSLTSITIPESVTSIGSSAFYGCSSLTSITIPDSVTSIGVYAFYGCSSLTSITILDSVTSIGNYAFRDCTGLTSITFEDMTGLTSIGSMIFDGCDNVKELIIQSGEVKDLGFSDLSNLKTVTLGDGVTSIEERAFHSCYNIQELRIDDLTSYLNISYGNSSSSPLHSANQAVSLYEGEKLITNLVIPDGVTAIPDYAFKSLNITSITIPDSVTSIGSSAFGYCSSLISITIPESVTSIGSSAFYYCISLTSITIPDSVTSIGIYAFEDCSSLKTVNFGDNSQLTSIGDSAFENCSSFTSITIPDSVTSIGYSAFENCSSLTSITIPEGVTSIGVYAFYGCSSLTSITIPDSVTSIGSSAFRYCYKLVEVYDLTGSEGLNITVGSEDNGYVGYYADYVYTDKDTELVQKAVDDYIFYYNDDIMYLLSYIGSDKELTLPSIGKVKQSTGFDCDTYEIYEYAFYENMNITSVTIPDGVTSIRNRAFYICSNLTSIIIPDSVTSIGSNAFYYCISLTSITIPDSVTSIGSSAFRDCDNLIIYCEAESEPSGWNSSWNNSNRPVYWAGKWEYDEVTGEPRPIESGVEGLSDIGEDFGIGFDGLGFREELYFNDKRERKVV